MTAAAPSLELLALRVQEWMHREFNELAPSIDIETAMQTPCSCEFPEAHFARAALQADPVAVDAERIIGELARYDPAPYQEMQWSLTGEYVRLDSLRAALTAPPTDALPAAVPAGFVLVPIQPTRAMLDAAHEDLVRTGEIDPMLKSTYAAMLAAAPNHCHGAACFYCAHDDAQPTDEAPPKDDLSGIPAIYHGTLSRDLEDARKAVAARDEAPPKGDVLARGWFHRRGPGDDYDIHDESSGAGKDCDNCIPCAIVRANERPTP